MLERDWQAQVVHLARLHNWKRPMHIYDSRRSEPGWPDLALVRDRLVLIECKTETGRVTATQSAWLTALDRASVEVYVARPRHLQHLSRILQARGPVASWNADQREARGHMLLELHQHLDPEEEAA